MGDAAHRPLDANTARRIRLRGRLAGSAGMITAAAAIVVVVFASFIVEDMREPKLFRFQLAMAVLEATLVRMALRREYAYVVAREGAYPNGSCMRRDPNLLRLLDLPR
jgi:RND superfamily putative drug exporter